MAQSSIHIQAGGSGYFAHNSRESKTVNAIFSDEENYCSCTNAKAFETYKKELSSRTNAYLENNPTRKKLHEKTITHLSAIVNFNKEHTPDDIKKVCDYLEKTFDTKVIQFAMHRDEGHINESGEKVKNYHAHIEFVGLDSKGNSVRRKLDKKALIELQSQTAKLLKMERGKNYTLLQEKRPKRLDTYEFKKAKEMEATKVKDLLATKDQLKEANNQLRAYMKENGANRQDYAELEREKKELEEKLKAKLLTEKELLEKFQKLEETFKTTLAQKDKFLGNLQEIGKEISKEVPIKTISEIPDAVKTVLTQNKSLEAQKEVLASKVTTLEEKIDSRANMSYPQPPISVQKEFELIKKEEFEEKSIKTGLFATEKAKVLKSETNFLQRTWNLVSSKYEDLKTKYNDLVKRFEDLTLENKILKADLEELRSSSSKQQNQTHKKDHLKEIVEQFEVHKGEKSDSSNLIKSKELTSREKFELQKEVIKKQEKEKIKEVPELQKEEKSNTKKRGYSNSR
jgi:hypothetical protein